MGVNLEDTPFFVGNFDGLPSRRATGAALASSPPLSVASGDLLERAKVALLDEQAHFDFVASHVEESMSWLEDVVQDGCAELSQTGARYVNQRQGRRQQRDRYLHEESLMVREKARLPHDP